VAQASWHIERIGMPAPNRRMDTLRWLFICCWKDWHIYCILDVSM
jgi:hypothetical protein